MSNEFDKELSDLWNSRGEGDPEKLEQLYRLIEKLLRNYTRPFARLEGLDGLDDTQRKDQYISDFFMDKVFGGGENTRCDHVGALKLFYKRYLEDVARKYEKIHRREISDHFESAGEEEDEEINVTDKEAHKQWEDNARAGEDVSGHFSALNELGLSEAFVAASLRKIIKEYSHPDKYWVILFIGYHYCQDADDREPLGKLAKRKKIQSYAYKAEKLGFNWRDAGNYQGFAEKTLLGQWLRSLGIDLIPENRLAIAEALKILCAEALSWVERQDDAPG
ncbi:hypothetical protein [Thiorhodospira sibirica]|uniref:hypothetical protein n=1 Tax=Thiorhodospira sibirica TaxID=154347 RepID=UPI00022C587D|nr:hypothetical protein [Thiorhodospira sibirica]